METDWRILFRLIHSFEIRLERLLAKMPFLKTPKQLQQLARLPNPRAQRNGWRKTIFLLNDCTYKGEWKNDLRNGKGTMKCCVKQYEGNWENNKPHGFGVLSNMCKDGNYDLEYYGYWQNGKKQGFGVSFAKDNYYEGNWSKHKKHGFGKMWFADGSYYEGNWAEDKFEGFGIMIYGTGNRYEGNWNKGLKNGQGLMYHVHTGQVQKGLWNKDIAVLTEMMDLTWRQSGDKPTRYPIPEIKFLDTDVNFTIWMQKARDQLPTAPKRSFKSVSLPLERRVTNASLNTTVM